MKRILVGLMLFAASSGAASAQDAASGERAFRKCSICHSVGRNAKNGVGPALNGLDGRKSGTAEGFTYSEANRAAAITWGEATFKDYIQDPRARIPGTKMVFAGIKDEDEANNLWAFLKQFGSDGEKK